MSTNTADHIEFLTSSENRIDLLRELAQQSGRKSELTRRCEASRATVHRAIEEMEDRGWVTDDNGEYRLTPIGTTLIEHYDEFEEAFSTILSKRSFFEYFESDIEMPKEVAEKFKLTTASPGDPHATMRVFRDATDSEVGRFAGVVPVLSPGYNQIAKEMFDSGTEMELVVGQDTLGAMQSGYQEGTEAALNSDNFTLYVYPEDLRISVALFDRSAAMIAAFDDEGQLQSGLDGSDEEAIEWTEQVFESIREQSLPITQPP
ncbi:helix-turn-helix transcriptional regulator [Saliphagus infecundisoli]|uniref:Helix-turn-helix transcriptional regulator n=1 Tax=Saliphagus infecundisoli TaxID=1849069 RepID=A0ABD5QID3_9EURY|nr:winged helix-turn-helix domain-containing protein [Saliphagus infecundisoli]